MDSSGYCSCILASSNPKQQTSRDSEEYHRFRSKSEQSMREKEDRKKQSAKSIFFFSRRILRSRTTHEARHARRRGSRPNSKQQRGLRDFLMEPHTNRKSNFRPKVLRAHDKPTRRFHLHCFGHTEVYQVFHKPMLRAQKNHEVSATSTLRFRLASTCFQLDANSRCTERCPTLYLGDCYHTSFSSTITRAAGAIPRRHPAPSPLTFFCLSRSSFSIKRL